MISIHQMLAVMITTCQPDGISNPKKIAASPALIPPPMLYKEWLVLINFRLYIFSNLLTVVFDDTLFKKLIIPKRYKQHHSMTRLDEFTMAIIISPFSI